MIYKIFFYLNLFVISVFAMEPQLQSINTFQEAECFQALIVAYKPREKLGEQNANQLSTVINYGYIIPKQESDTNLLLATLTDKMHYTRLINEKTLRIQPMLLRLADTIEIGQILKLMKSSYQHTFDFMSSQADADDTSVVLSRYNLSDIENALNNPKDQRKNKKE